MISPAINIPLSEDKKKGMASSVSIPIEDDERLGATEMVRSIVNPYFFSLVFSFLETKEGYSLYGARVVSPGISERLRKFILLFVPGSPTASRSTIAGLPWVNLQTRTLASGYDLPAQEWKFGKLTDLRLEILSRSPAQTTFALPGLPAKLIYLHDTTAKCVGPACAAKYQIYNHTPLSKALMTFRISIALD